MAVYETTLPGVGKKFEFDLEEDARLVIVIHNTGRREIFHKETEDADAEKLFELTDEEARQFGTILEGAYFQPVGTQTVETLLDDETLLEWVEVEDGAEIAGQTLVGSNLRQDTGVSVLAVRRGNETFASPEPEFEFDVGDTLVALGPEDGIAELVRRCGLTPGREDAPSDQGDDS